MTTQPQPEPGAMTTYLARSLAPMIARMIEIRRGENERLAELMELELDNDNPNQS